MSLLESSFTDEDHYDTDVSTDEYAGGRTEALPGKRLPVTRSIKDSIHDYIPISPLLTRFIDTSPFQRLREIKQLGTSCLVWPGASHNRFEHCLGVAFLGRLLSTHLQKNQPELGISDRDVDCVELAGLCHDLGHGPWSHVWDGLFMPAALPGCKWRHEDGSDMMFEYLIKESKINLNTDDKMFIKALIAGDPKMCSKDEKPFLFDIIANKRNGLDVDKFDYIQRDSHMIGNPISLSLQRIIKSARVLDNQICYDIKDANQIYEICAMRFKLHKIFYNHKVAKAMEYMIIDGLLAAEPFLKIAERVFDPEKYVHLTDNIMPHIEASNSENLAPARAIFKRIRTRNLYKCVDYKVLDWPYIEVFQDKMTPARIVEEARRIADDGEEDVEAVEGLEASRVIVDLSVMHYGMMDKNPLDFVKFYSKRQPDTCANAGRGDYSTLMPQIFAEVLLRVYTKDVRYFGIVQAGYRAVLKEINEYMAEPITIDDDEFLSAFPLPSVAVPLVAGGSSRSVSTAVDSDGGKERLGGRGRPSRATPPVTDGPTTPTPRVFSRHASFTSATGKPLGSGGFENNSFTTVPPSFVPGSPSREGLGRRVSLKRGREGKGQSKSPTKKKRE